METAIRWSPRSTSLDQQFLYIDVKGQALRLCRITSPGSTATPLTSDTIATHSKVPPFRAFDWSPTNPALVCVGQSSGEASVLRIDDGSEASISFPIRNQRLCNAVAFNTQGLLAAGLDKVRNDFCLNVWDLNQRVPNIGGSGNRGFATDKGYAEPYCKLASSEPITSIKFFADQPQTLVAGVKAQFVRLYDLREPTGTSTLQFATRAVHNLAIDPCDENYIASCMPNNDAIICVWDRRAGSRYNSSGFSFGVGSDSGQTGPSIELKNIADVQSTIFSLRFAKTKRGCLGMLTSTGQFKTFELGKEFLLEDERKERDESWGQGWVQHYPEKVYVDRIQDLEKPYHNPKTRRKETDRVVSFDFAAPEQGSRGPVVLTLAANGRIQMAAIGRERAAQSFFPFRPTSTSLPDPEARDPMRKEGLSLSSKLAAAKLILETSSGGKNLSESRENPMWLFRDRCERGYQFDAVRNKSVVAKDADLASAWRWIDRATSLAKTSSLTDAEFDLSYLGVHSIWMDELGIDPPYTSRRVSPATRPTPNPSNTAMSLATTLRLPPLSPSPQTAFAAHRQLCLYVSGLQKGPDALKRSIEKSIRRGNITKAAAKALFASQPKLATWALRQKPSTETHKMLAMAIASAQSRKRLGYRRLSASSHSSADSEDSESDWDLTLSSLLSSLPPATTDPYAHAIVHTIIHGTPSHASILSNAALPLPLAHKIFIALHHLSDSELTSYLAKSIRHHIANGELTGLLLTGIGTPRAVSLFGNYISRTGDVQTAVLALTPVIPRYLSNANMTRLFESWRDEYRTQMQIWDLKFQRVKFDVAGRKLAVSRTGVPLIPPSKKQISITCSYCQQPITQIPAPAKPGYSEQDDNSPDKETTGGTSNLTSGLASTTGTIPGPVPTKITMTKTQRNPLTSMRAAAIGTICPKCGRNLPRCGICEMPLGMPDETYVMPLSTARNATPSASAAAANENPKGSVASTTRTAINGHISEQSEKATNDTNANELQQESNTKPEASNWDSLMAKFITFCINCGHGFHAGHAREWFGGSGTKVQAGSRIGGLGLGGHKVCPVADCGCVCDTR